MLDLDAVLLTPERKPTLLREHAGSQGTIVTGVGKGAERGYQMIYRLSGIGTDLARAGFNVLLTYPKESARHVMDPLSVSSQRLQRSLILLLDAENRFFRQPQQPRILSFNRLDIRDIRLHILLKLPLRLDNDAWAQILSTWLSEELNSVAKSGSTDGS